MFTKKLDKLGRIVIPKDLRKKLDIEIGDNLDVQLDGNGIIVKKANSNPIDELKTIIEKQDNKELKTELLGVLLSHTRSDRD